MPTAEIRKFDVTASDAEIALVRGALDRCSLNPAKYLGRRVSVEFTTDLPRRKDGGPAEAFSRLKARRILIRPGQRDKRTQYLFLHEVAHFIDEDFLTDRKRRELMQLMVPAPRHWLDGRYMELPCECFADAFAGAITDLTSPHGKFYTRDIPVSKLARMIEIALRDDGGDGNAMGTGLDEGQLQPPTLDDLMEQIVRIESSGRPLAQNPRTGASGLYGFMPRMWRVTAPRVLGSTAEAKTARDMKPADWRPELTEQNQHAVARSEFRRLARRFDDDLQMVAASWRNGEGFVARTPTSKWSRGLIKYVNTACEPLGFGPLAPSSTEPDDTTEEQPVTEDSTLPLNIVDHEVGLIKAGTKVFYPTPDTELTTIASDAPRAQLLGRTEDGRFRFVMVTSDKYPGATRGNPIKGLALVAAENVSNVRVDPPGGIDPAQVGELQRRKQELEERIAVLTNLRDKVDQSIREAAERLRLFLP